MALDVARSPSLVGLRGITVYSVLWFSGLRIGHIAPKSLGRAKHLLR